MMGVCTAVAAAVDPAPPLPAPTGTVVRVSTEAELQSAIQNLTSNMTVLIAPGTYRLSSTLHIGNRPLTDVALRGATDRRDDVVLLGPGITNASYGAAPSGIWVGNGVARVLIANLTVREFYYHPIILNAGVQSPHLYNVRLAEGGQQLLKSNPDSAGRGNDDGLVEYSIFEFNDTSRDYYTNGVDVLGGARWIIRHNLFRNIRAPLGQLAGPSILLWRGSRDTVVEGNTFVNCQREVALGLDPWTPNDHSGGVIRNNFIYRESSVAGDAGISVFDSPGTQVVHNTVLTSGTYQNAIEYRFPDTTGVLIANNLVDAAIRSRDGAVAMLENNITNATRTMFTNSYAGDLHLVPTATGVIDKVTGAYATTDWDGQRRPFGVAADIGADEAAALITNTPPTVTITSPKPGAKLSSTDPVVLSANATDRDGSVQQVAFYANGSLIATDTTAPYSVTWSNTAAGPYTFGAVATDNTGATTSAASVSVTVEAAACHGKNCKTLPPSSPPHGRP
jgi:Big-like domain-containing protein